MMDISENAIWITDNFSASKQTCIGVVFGTDTVTKKKKAYIGSCLIGSEKDGCEFIARHGTKLPLHLAKEIVSRLEDE